MTARRITGVWFPRYLEQETARTITPSMALVTANWSCDFCWNDIQHGAGRWYKAVLDILECFPCRVDGQRAEFIHAAISPSAGAPQLELSSATEEAA